MCKYCDDDSKVMSGKNYKILGNIFEVGAFVLPEENKLIVEFGDEVIFAKRINYCPICGRKLNE